METLQERIAAWQLEARTRTGAELLEFVNAALAAIDGYTDGHTHRVAQYCLLLATRIPAAQHVSYLTFALHDIGKILVPAELICKPSALTSEEYRIIQQHPELGLQLIGDLPELQPAAEVILSHHERWDGAGYPHRLAGTAIPLAARILSVADAFDAMTTDRPYRKRMPAEDARFEVMRCAGTQFDPQVVEAFLAVWSQLLKSADIPVRC